MAVCFISKLVGKIKRKKDLLKAVLKFRYHTPSKSIHHFNHIWASVGLDGETEK